MAQFPNFGGTSISMEIGKLKVPWHSINFCSIISLPFCMTTMVPWNSVELWVSQFRSHGQFHGIPWNLNDHKIFVVPWMLWNHWCHPLMKLGKSKSHERIPWIFCGITWNLRYHRNWQSLICIEFYPFFHGTNLRVLWNFLNNIWTTLVSMEFHGTSATDKVP